MGKANCRGVGRRRAGSEREEIRACGEASLSSFQRASRDHSRLERRRRTDRRDVRRGSIIIYICTLYFISRAAARFSEFLEGAIGLVSDSMHTQRQVPQCGGADGSPVASLAGWHARQGAAESAPPRHRFSRERGRLKGCVSTPAGRRTEPCEGSGSGAIAHACRRAGHGEFSRGWPAAHRRAGLPPRFHE